MTADVEKEGVWIRYVTGYATLAEFIASDPDHSTAIRISLLRQAVRKKLAVPP
jgi:hypothetical protein